MLIPGPIEKIEKFEAKLVKKEKRSFVDIGLFKNFIPLALSLKDFNLPKKLMRRIKIFVLIY